MPTTASSRPAASSIASTGKSYRLPHPPPLRNRRATVPEIEKAPACARALMKSRLFSWFSPEVRHDVPVDAGLELVDVVGVLETVGNRQIDHGRRDGAVHGHGAGAEI